MEKTKLAERIKDARKRMRMSRMDLAESLGVAESTVWRWEHSECTIRMGSWSALRVLLLAKCGDILDT